MNSRAESLGPDGTTGIEDLYPLTPLQGGMFYHTLVAPDSGVYVVQYTCEIHGSLDPAAFRSAWVGAFERHGALRTAFVWEGLEEPLQVVRDHVSLPWIESDWRDRSASRRETDLELLLREDRAAGFRLDLAPLVRLRLIRIDKTAWRFVWTFHHLLADGWSAVTVLREVFQSATDPLFHAPTPRPFRDFVAWLASRDPDRTRAYWEDRLAGVGEPTTVRPGHAPLGSRRVDERLRSEIALSATDTTALRDFGRAHRLTVNTIVHGAWSLIASRYSGEATVLYGAAVSGRPASVPGVESMIGLFLNTVPVRVDIPEEVKRVDWLRTLQDDLIDHRPHEHVSLPSIAEWTGIGGSRAPFETVLVFESSPLGQRSPAQDTGLELRDTRYVDQSDFPLALLVFPEASLRVAALYDPARFEADFVTRLLEALAETLRSMVAQPDLPVGTLPPPGPQEQARLLALAGGVPAASEARDVLARFYEQAARIPASKAVVFEREVWTYGELEAGVRACAEQLRTLGVVKGTRVGLVMDRSPSMIQALLGVLDAGGAYVPMATDDPDARKRFVIEDVGAEVVVTDDPGRIDAFPSSVRSLVLDRGKISGIDRDPASPTESAGGTDAPDDVAYVLYTSGSTGGPKGVAVTRANLAYSTAVREDVYGAGPNAFLLVSPLTFDSSVVGLYWTLSSGGTLVLPGIGQERDPAALAGLIRSRGITHTLCIPALWEAMLERADLSHLESLDTVIVAGEACPGRLARNHMSDLPGVRLFNEYGPTEATVWASVFRVPVDFEGEWVPIGRPIPGARLYLTQGENRLSPEDSTGEICIAGPGVSPGYVNRDALSSERFGPDPFVEGEGARLYRTGDLGRWSRDGQLRFIGRIDEQIKVRGRRIEPGEIEAALTRQASVYDAVVLGASAGGEGQLQDSADRLVAYVVAQPGHQVRGPELRALLAAELPEFMIPVDIAIIDSIPRGPTGKMDRGQLPPIRGGSAVVEPGESPILDPLEVRLGLIWERVLGTWPIYLDDDFFDLGGHSLLAVRLLDEIESEVGRGLPLATFFEAPTVRSLARALQSDGWTPPGGPLVTMQPEGADHPLFVVHSFEGHVFFYNELARSMAPDHPVYGLQAPGLGGEGRLSRRVEQLADLHIGELRRAQPTGPYCIAAMCFGVAEALELAVRLEREGEQVSVIFIDSVLDGHGARGRTNSGDSIPARLEQRARSRVRLIRERIRHLREANGSGDFGRHERRMRLALIKAWDAYRPPMLDGTITLIRSEENVTDPDKQWQVDSVRSVTNAEVVTHVVPGDHFALLRHPNVETVADLIRGLM